MVRAGWDPQRKLHPDNPRVFLGYNDTLYVGSLPVALFSGGHTYYIQKLHEVKAGCVSMSLIVSGDPIGAFCFLQTWRFLAQYRE